MLVASASALELIVAHALFGVTYREGVVALVAVIVPGTLVFSAMAFAIAAVSTSARSANRAANLLLIPMMALGGTSLPAAMLPDWWNTVR